MLLVFSPVAKVNSKAGLRFSVLRVLLSLARVCKNSSDEYKLHSVEHSLTVVKMASCCTSTAILDQPKRSMREVMPTTMLLSEATVLRNVG